MLTIVVGIAVIIFNSFCLRVIHSLFSSVRLAFCRASIPKLQTLQAVVPLWAFKEPSCVNAVALRAARNVGGNEAVSLMGLYPFFFLFFIACGRKNNLNKFEQKCLSSRVGWFQTLHDPGSNDTVSSCSPLPPTPRVSSFSR